METVRIASAQQVDVAERVTCTDGHRTILGHVAKKGRTYATVVTDDERTYRVPCPLLTRLVGTPRRHVQTRSDTLQAPFQEGDRVSFMVDDRPQAGVLSRLNPR